MTHDYVKLQNKIIISFEDGTIYIEGIKQHNTLTPSECRVLKCYLDNSPAIVTWDELIKKVWLDMTGVWDHARLPVLQKFHSEIKKKCGLKEKLVKKCDQIGYKLNPIIKFEWVETFSLRTLSPNDIFIKPEHYIHPLEWISELNKNAFKYTNVHVISGERGIGKTDLARKKIELLNKLQKPTLLIIDNYDNENSYKEELSENSKIYRALRDTGCHILLTSKVDLNSCFGLHQTKLSHLPFSSLCDLFLQIADNIEEDNIEVMVKELVGKYLCYNTYLVRLSAKLTATRTISEILFAFQNMNAGSIDDPIDGKNQDENSLIEHYKLLFNISSIVTHPQKCHLLYAMALLPPDGIPYNEFFESAFDFSEALNYKYIFKALYKSFWVNLKQKQVSLHPLIREILAQQQLPFNATYIIKYIEKLNENLCYETYSPGLSENIKRGLSACDIIKRWGVINIETCCLFANITSVYDIIDYKDLVYSYGKFSISCLNSINKDYCSNYELLKLARAYNIAGYAILHAYNKPDSTTLSESALLTADSIISYLRNTEINVDKLYTLNQGNIAALYLVKKEYNKALCIHEKNKNFRNYLLQKEPTCDNKRLLAASYKGIATTYYYLSKCTDLQHEMLLRESFKYHTIAMQYYEESYKSEYHLDIAIINNRRTGTALSLFKYLENDERIKLGTELLAQTKTALKYLCNMQPLNNMEIELTIHNISSILEMLKISNALNQKMSIDIAEIISYIKKINTTKKNQWLQILMPFLNQEKSKGGRT